MDSSISNTAIALAEELVAYLSSNSYEFGVLGGLACVTGLAYLLRWYVRRDPNAKLRERALKMKRDAERNVVSDVIFDALFEAEHKGALGKGRSQYWARHIGKTAGLSGLLPRIRNVRKLKRKLHPYKANKKKAEILARLNGGENAPVALPVELKSKPRGRAGQLLFGT